jgi:hypothetical protein
MNAVGTANFQIGRHTSALDIFRTPPLHHLPGVRPGIENQPARRIDDPLDGQF